MAFVVASSISTLAVRAEPTPALERSVPRPVAWRELDDVIADVRAIKDAGGTPLVVFDIDETLIISPRGIHWDPKMKVIPGALEYVQAVLDAGATVVYFTGRKTWMRRRTEAELKRLELPMGPNVKLIMNPTQYRGFIFKALWGPRLLRLGTPVGFFENEKDNVRLFRAQYPAARVLRLNTRARYPDSGHGARGITVIDDFRRPHNFRDDRPRLRAQTRRR